MFEHQDRRKIGSMLAVVVLMLCALAPLSTGGEGLSAGDSAESYDIAMRTGDVFTYTPVVSMDNASIDVDLSRSTGISSADWTYGGQGDTLTVTFGSMPSSDARIALKAHWESPDKSSSVTKYQYLNFEVYEHVNINGMTGTDPATNTVVTSAYANSTMIYGIPNDNPEGTVITMEQTEGPMGYYWYHDNYIMLNTENIPHQNPSAPTGTYKFTITATHSDPSSSIPEDVVKVYVVAFVGDAFQISSPAYVETYVGDTEQSRLSYEVTTNYDGDDGTRFYSLHKAIYSSIDPAPEGFWDDTQINNGKISWDPSVITFPEGASVDQTKIYKFTAYAYAVPKDGADIPTVQKEVRVVVHPYLAFISAPSIENVKTYRTTSGNPLDMVLTGTFSNAQEVVVDWGDGTHTEETYQDAEVGKTYLFSHLYNDSRTYNITVTATNERGSKTVHNMYDATAGMISVEHTVTLKDKDSNTVGTVQVENGQKIDLSKVVYDDGYDMAGKKIRGIYEDQGLTTPFDSAVNADRTLYVSIGGDSLLWVVPLIITVVLAGLFVFAGMRTIYIAIPMAACAALTVLLMYFGGVI